MAVNAGRGRGLPEPIHQGASVKSRPVSRPQALAQLEYGELSAAVAGLFPEGVLPKTPPIGHARPPVPTSIFYTRSVVIAEEMAGLALSPPNYYEGDRETLCEAFWQDVQLSQFITRRGMGDRLLGFATFWRVSRELAEELAAGYFRPPPEHLVNGPCVVLHHFCADSEDTQQWLVRSLWARLQNSERVIVLKDGACIFSWR